MAFTPASVQQNVEPPKKEAKRAATAEERKRLAQEERIKLEEERVYRKGIVSIRDLIAPSGMVVKPDRIRLGDLFARTIFVVRKAAAD